MSKANRKGGGLLVTMLLALTCSVGLTGSAAFAHPAGQQPKDPGPKMAGVVPKSVQDRSATRIGSKDETDTLYVLFMLPERDPNGLSAFIADASNPSSPNYGHYMTLAEENARFNPDATTEGRVMQWLTGAGINDVKTTQNHLYVSAHATVAQLNALLSIQINNYKQGSRSFFAPDHAPTLPASISNDVSWIAGLQSATRFRTLNNGIQDGQAPYYPQDIANAYDVNPLWAAGNTGAGTSIGITLWGGAPSDTTLQSWAATTHAAVATRANGRLIIVPVDGGSTYADVGEAGMDIESSGGVAYQAQIRYYEAPTDSAGNPTTLASLTDALNQAGTDPANNRQISSSWGGDEDQDLINAFEPVFRANTATGHDYLFSSGDNGSASNQPPYNDPTPSYPGASPYVTSIGGTRFIANISAGWPGERTWDYSLMGNRPEGSGGGYSNIEARPSWQVAPGFNNAMRGYPDVSAVADPETGFYVCYGNSGACGQIGGTSLSSPLWAGFMAITNQYLSSQGKPQLGFVNPRLYRMASTQQPLPAFHDITDGTNGNYNTGAGWDAVTGIGTPDVWNLAQDFAVCDLPFTDVATGSSFYPYVHCLTCKNIMSGYACGGAGEPCDDSQDAYFRPGALITRGQIAKVVSNAAGYNEPHSDQTFQDVPTSSPFYIWIQRLSSRGFMTGYTCGGADEPCVAPGNKPYFRPGAYASRGQLSKIVSSAAGYNENHTEQTFQDVPTSQPFYIWIQRLSSRSFISGYACGGAGEPCVAPGNKPYFRPGVNVSRGQAAKIVSNTFFPNCQTLDTPWK